MMKATLLLSTLTCVPILAVPVAMQPTKMPVHEKGAVSLVKQEVATYAPICYTADGSAIIVPVTMGGSKTTMLGGESVSPNKWCNTDKPSAETCAKQIVFDPPCMSSVVQGQEAQLSCSTWASMSTSTSFSAWDCAWNADLGKCKASSMRYTCPMAFADTLTTVPTSSTANAVALHAVAKGKPTVSLAKTASSPQTIYDPWLASCPDAAFKKKIDGGGTTGPWCNQRGAVAEADCPMYYWVDSTLYPESLMPMFSAYTCKWNAATSECKADKYFTCPFAPPPSPPSSPPPPPPPACVITDRETGATGAPVSLPANQLAGNSGSTPDWCGTDPARAAGGAAVCESYYALLGTPTSAEFYAYLCTFTGGECKSGDYFKCNTGH